MEVLRIEALGMAMITATLSAAMVTFWMRAMPAEGRPNRRNRRDGLARIGVGFASMADGFSLWPFSAHAGFAMLALGGILCFAGAFRMRAAG